ncbi:MAG: PLP-dependent aminotransferase family protein, partial [Planctomycetota bacterium]
GGTTDPTELRRASKGAACLVVQSPNAFGCVEDLEAIAAIAKENGCISIAVVNPIALGLLKPPGACGCDIAVGDGQPLGGDPSFGGPSFGFLAAKKDFMRRVPGRIVGQTTDREGKRAFVLTLQAREQHIRREKASSNICTNQALMALRATIFLAGLGRHGLPKLADLCLQKAHYLEEKIAAIPGVTRPFSAPFFHEFVVMLPKPPAEVNEALLRRGFVGGAPIGDWAPDLRNPWLLCATETCTKEDMDAFAEATADILK